jgi:hypothetical protein
LHDLGHLLFSDRGRRADGCTHAATNADDLVNLGYLFGFVPDQSRTFENARAQLIASAIFTNAGGFIDSHFKTFLGLFFRAQGTNLF